MSCTAGSGWSWWRWRSSTPCSLTLHTGGGALDLYLPSAGWSTFSGVVAFVLLIGFVAASWPAVSATRGSCSSSASSARRSCSARSTPSPCGAPRPPRSALTLYLACLTAAGVASLGYRLFGGRLGAGRHRYRVDEVRRLAEDAVEIVMAPVGPPLEFQAGQFVYATFHQDGIPRESHPFTIASAPGGELRIAVKRFGDYTGC